MSGTGPHRRPGRGGERAGQVQSLTRALRLLRIIAGSAEGMTLADLVQIGGLAPSTAHRLLTTLEGERFVRFESEGGLWQIGVEAFVVGSAFARTRNLLARARPYLRRLMEESGETANLYVEEGGEAVCLGQVECRQVMRAIARPGGRVKLHGSGVGKAILAHLDDAELTRILQQHGMPRTTDRTLDTPRRLREDLMRVRARGWALDDEENAVGLRCVAAAVLDEHGRPVAGLSLSGPTARIDDAALPRLGALAVRIAAELTAALGGRAESQTLAGS
jgi:IclR family acetate operon transcriptional repressor